MEMIRNLDLEKPWCRRMAVRAFSKPQTIHELAHDVVIKVCVFELFLITWKSVYYVL